ncbi:MAG: type II secretion system F family protein [Candidatus Omnitrophica bacterium]|nr:type II secretion system F family protein [Candidatus Omnitrophota bacterium]
MFFKRTKILMVFYRKLAQMVSSGVPIVETMSILAEQEESLQLRRTASLIKEALDKGLNLGDAFAQFPEMFSDIHINIIRYSETAGRLAQGLESLADYLEKEYSIRQELLKELAYPVVLLHAAMFLLPIVDSVGCGTSCGLTGYIHGVLSLFIPVYAVVFLGYAITRGQSNAGFKNALDSCVVSIPRIGTLVKQFALAKFIRVLQILSASGVTIITSWKMAAESCGNTVIKASLLKGLTVIEKGGGLRDACSATKMFSGSVIGMIAVAEKSGSMVQTLNTIASYSERENETSTAMLLKIIPFFIYVAVAGFIAFKIISFYTAYFNKIFSIGG